MSYIETLLQYNGFLLLFSAIGFLFSLVWVLLTEKSERNFDSDQKLQEKDLFDEKVFFDEFESMKNPTHEANDLKPIFEKISPSHKDSESNMNIKKTFSKDNDFPSFPILKKEIKDRLENDTDQKNEVNNLLGEIKKEIKKNTKSKRRKKK